MSSGTSFTSSIDVKYKVLKDVYDVDNAIAESEEYIKSLRERILMQCAFGANHNYKDCAGYDYDPIDYLHGQVSEWLNEYDREHEELYALRLLREDWNEEEQKFDTAYTY